MPIYEFSCRSCAQQFETLVRTGDVPQCPSCAGQDLERIISLFAVNSEGTRSIALAEGRRRASKTAGEKAVAQREYEAKHDDH
jgi:putative FmdB family regulatory protein